MIVHFNFCLCVFLPFSPEGSTHYCTSPQLHSLPVDIYMMYDSVCMGHVASSRENGKNTKKAIIGLAINSHTPCHG